jgi:hypothetical protein
MATAVEQRDGIGQVREILVGGVQRDIERKLARLEVRFTSRITEAREEERRRTDVVEAHLQKELEKLGTRIEGDMVGFKETSRAFARDHREMISALEQRIAKLEEALARSQHEVRKQLLDQAKSFMDEVHRMREELVDAVNRELRAVEVEVEESDEQVEHHGSREALESSSQ